MSTAVKPNAFKASFPVRRMDFEFAQTPRHWFGLDAGMTHFLTSLSVLFPEGEGFFVDSVRAVRHDPLLVGDKRMQKEISAFIGQEAMHSKEHEAFNRHARAQGYPVERMEKATRRIIYTTVHAFSKVAGRLYSREQIQMAGTCALEHFTATIAAQLLRREDLHALMHDPVMMRLWLWHAIEENEHKAVAFDVFERLYGRKTATYALRALVMVAAMAILVVAQNVFMHRLMQQDGKAAPRHWWRVLRMLYGPRGFISQIIPELLDYFRPGFHPNDHDTEALLKKWTDQLALMQPVAAAA